MIGCGHDAVRLQFIEKGPLGHSGTRMASARPDEHGDATMTETEEGAGGLGDGRGFPGTGPGETHSAHGSEKGKGRHRSRGEPLEHFQRRGHDNPGIRRGSRDEFGDAVGIHSQFDE